MSAPLTFAEQYVADLRARRQHLANKRPPFAASREAQGCGTPRVRGEGPLTYAQHLWEQETAHYYENVLGPWRAEVAKIDAELEALGIPWTPG